MFRNQLIVLLLLALGVVFGVTVFTKPRTQENLEKEQQKILTKVEERQGENNFESMKDATDYKSVASFKLASRKKDYRMGELISIDAALLNKSKKDLHFLDLGGWINLSVIDSTNNEVDFEEYNCILPAPTFNLLKSGEYDSAKGVFLVGCKDADKKLKIPYESMEKDFYTNNFVNMGKGCLRVNKTGKYFIKATMSNSFVEEDKRETIVVGEIESNLLEINISR